MAVEPTTLGLGACVSKAFIRLETISPILRIKMVGQIVRDRSQGQSDGKDAEYGEFQRIDS